MNIETSFKSSPIGEIPINWQVKPIDELVSTVSAPFNYKTDQYLNEGEFPIIDQGKKEFCGFTDDPTSLINNTPLVLFGDHTKEVKFAANPFAVGADGVKILNSNILDIQFLYFSLIRAASRLPDLGYSRHYTELKNILIAIPTSDEQKSISQILFTQEEYIHKKESLVKELEKRSKGLKQQLLSGKVRFSEFVQKDSSVKTPVGEIPEDWDLKHISDITQRVKKPITPEPETLYREIGIRSHCKGIFHKEEVTGASLGNKSVFWIQPDCFVVNIVFAWEHAIAKTTEAEVAMIASHRFPMYKPKKGVLDLDYLLYYFKTARGKHLLGLASPGGAGRNKTLGQGEFAKLKIPVPSLAEQKRIVAVLSEADREIELLKQQIATLKEQKKGLMQKLLTGEIRVKTE